MPVCYNTFIVSIVLQTPSNHVLLILFGVNVMKNISRYYEDLAFDIGTKINVSRQIDDRYFNTVHWHPYVEVLFSLCDGNRATVSFIPYELNKNDLVVVYSGELHSVQSLENDSCLIIQFPLALLAVIGELNSVLPRLSGFNCIHYDKDDPETVQMARYAESIMKHHFGNEPFREVLVYADLLNLFALIGSRCIRSGDGVPASGGGFDRANLELMTEACLYISENCMKPLSLNDVASQVGVSRSHFAHLFKDYTNMTFVDFLTMERVKLAETCFMNPQLRMIDIAFESGFSSISSFNRAFRKIKGCSPTEFRSTMID